jgi:hypothetical protein
MLSAFSKLQWLSQTSFAIHNIAGFDQTTWKDIFVDSF